MTFLRAMCLLAMLTHSIAHASDYRQQAAEQIYAAHREQVYTGQLPPLLHAIGVVRVVIGRSGNVSEVVWLRRPNDAVAAKIESLILTTIRIDPAPENTVTFVETWLWHSSNKFQLLLFTEGQK